MIFHINIGRIVTRMSLVFLAMVIFYSSAHAAYMDCLTKARNRELSWNAAWGQDRRDNNAIYKITSISERNDIFSASRSVTLQLKSSNSSVFMKQRQLVVDAEDRARAVCDRLIKPTRLLVFPKGPDKEPENNSSQIEPVESEDLPFIMHTTDGWVRANPPSGAQLDVCRVLQRRFSCLQKDKRKYRENLKTLEEELKYQVSFD